VEGTIEPTITEQWLLPEETVTVASSEKEKTCASYAQVKSEVEEIKKRLVIVETLLSSLAKQAAVQ